MYLINDVKKQGLIYILMAIVIGGAPVIGSGVTVLYVVTIAWILMRIIRKEESLSLSYQGALLSGAFIFFFLCELISGLSQLDKLATWKEIVENIPFLGIPFLYSSLMKCSRLSLQRALNIGILFGSIGAGVVSVFQVFYMMMERAFGGAGNPGPFAVVSAALYGFCLLLGLQKGGITRVLFLFGAFNAGLAVLLSGMRILWPVLFLFPILSIILISATIKRKNFFLIVCGIGGILLFLSRNIIQHRTQEFAQDIYKIEATMDYSTSIGQRIRLWGVGWELFQKKPFFGYGPGQIRQVIQDKTQMDGKGSPFSFSHFHNAVLNSLIRGGFLNLIGLFLLFFLPFWLARRTHRDNLAQMGFSFLILGDLSYLISGLSNIMLGHDILDIWFISMNATCCVLICEAKKV